MRSRVAVLASGGGSNLQAILEHFEFLGDNRAGDIVLVASDRSNAGALDRAANRGIATSVLANSKNPDGAPLDAVLEEYAVDLIVLAGYLRLVPAPIVAKYDARIINVHPALLPGFGGPGMYGQRVHHAVIDSGARVSGVTVHFVNNDFDRGCIIAQWPVPVFPSDDAGTLADRVLRVEHMLYPRVIDAVAGGRITLASCSTVDRSSLIDARPSFTLLPHDDSRLTENIDLALRRLVVG